MVLSQYATLGTDEVEEEEKEKEIYIRFYALKQNKKKALQQQQ